LLLCLAGTRLIDTNYNQNIQDWHVFTLDGKQVPETTSAPRDEVLSDYSIALVASDAVLERVDYTGRFICCEFLSFLLVGELLVVVRLKFFQLVTVT